ncbi:diaminopimelate epimerase, partial [bacterium]
SLAQKLCDRNKSIGADGLLVLEDSKTTDFTMRIINADGSEVEMCGNGARCIAYFAHVLKIADHEMSFKTHAGLIQASVDGTMVKVKMIEPFDLKQGKSLKFVDGQEIKYSFLNTGVPHVVVFNDDVSKVDVKKLGHDIRFHEAFYPKGTNVNFAQVLSDNSIKVRTYERGVEDETLACGTGSTACAILASLEKGVKSPTSVETSGGEILNIYYKIEDNKIKSVFLEGNVKIVFKGTIEI